MPEDYRKLVKDILTNEETKKVVIHLPEDMDVSTSDRIYKQIYDTLIKNKASYASVHITTELRSKESVDLHDYLLANDSKYESC
jgi:hypothetical protein